MSINLNAQAPEDIIKWTAEFDKEASAIIFEATIADGWMTYSPFTNPEGPVPTEFEYEKLEGVELVGELEELTVPKVSYSEMFELEVMKFSKTAKFSQKVKQTGAPINITGSVFYMCCDHMKCLPPTSVPFTIKP